MAEMQPVAAREEVLSSPPRLIETTSNPLAATPHAWANIIQDLSRSSDPSATKLNTIYSLRAVVKECDNATWAVAWERGFVRAVAEVVTRDCICGFTSEDLASSEGQDIGIISFISSMTDLLRLCLDKVFATSWRRHVESKKLLDVLQSDLLQMYDKLWEIRTPFLLSELAYTRTGPIAIPLHESLCYLIKVTRDILKARRTFDDYQTTWRIPHVLLLIWIYCPDRNVRCEAITNICHVPGDQFWSSFFLNASHGCTDREQITAAIMRDLKDDKLLDDRLSDAAWVAKTFSSLDPGDGRLPVLWLEPQLVLWGLAAGRRQMCQGCNLETVFVNVASLLFEVIHPQISCLPRVSNKTVYELLGLICYFAYDVIVEREGPDRLLHIVTWFVPLLQAHPLDPEDRVPKTLAIRRYTHEFMRKITADMTRERLTSRSRGWRTFSVLWQRVGWLVPEVSDLEQDESPFELLKRCAWHQCLCSVHEPKHRMRVCKGCWVVAYCGTKCQIDDWHEHRRRCRNYRG